MPRFVVLAWVVLGAGACGATFNPSGLNYEPTPASSSADDRVIETVSLACIGRVDDAAAFVPCDGAAVPRDGALVVVWLHGSGTQWPAEHYIALNDVELEPTRHVTIAGEAIPVYALADAFPEVRRGPVLPPASYHVRVQVRSIDGIHTMHEEDVVIR